MLLHQELLKLHCISQLCLVIWNSQNPGLVHELNLQGLNPIHIASAKGYSQIVKDMLDFDPTLALIKDQDGRIPLHYAAIKDRL